MMTNDQNDLVKLWHFYLILMTRDYSLNAKLLCNLSLHDLTIEMKCYIIACSESVCFWQDHVTQLLPVRRHGRVLLLELSPRNRAGHDTC